MLYVGAGWPIPYTQGAAATLSRIAMSSRVGTFPGAEGISVATSFQNLKLAKGRHEENSGLPGTHPKLGLKRSAVLCQHDGPSLVMTDASICTYQWKGRCQGLRTCETLRVGEIHSTSCQVERQ